MSISNFAENALLDAVGGTAFVVSSPYLKLHTGDPGEDGTANAAGENTLQACSFNAASGGSMGLTAAVSWTNVSDNETLTHWSLWNGNAVDGSGEPTDDCVWTGAFNSSSTVAAGDTFTITSLTLTLD
jgi:hypothetical protein